MISKKVLITFSSENSFLRMPRLLGWSSKSWGQ